MQLGLLSTHSGHPVFAAKVQTMDGGFFFEIAGVAVGLHIFAFMGASCLEWVFNPRGWTRGLNSINSTSKLFTAQRRDVQFLFSWVLIWIARLALLVAPLAGITGLVLHNL